MANSKMKAAGVIAAVFLGVFLTGCASVLSAVNDQPIQQNPSTRSWGAWMDDQTIETVAAVNIKKADPAFADSHISVVSHNGIVLLIGQTGSESLKVLAGDTVRKVQKVRKVYNELEIAGTTTALVRSSDSYITGKVKSLLMAEKDFPAGNVKVITENGTVYLMGLVTPEQATTAVNITKRAQGIQKIVKVFEYI